VPNGPTTLREGRSPDARFDALTYFFHDVPRQSDAIFSSPLQIDVWPEVPLRVLIGRDDRHFPRAFQQRVATERLSIAGDEIPGGHLVALSHPVELAEQLTLYARELVVGRGPSFEGAT
jgi:pimeloyl-ACP methyl ester carboxylesterase